MRMTKRVETMSVSVVCAEFARIYSLIFFGKVATRHEQREPAIRYSGDFRDDFPLLN